MFQTDSIHSVSSDHIPTFGDAEKCEKKINSLPRKQHNFRLTPHIVFHILMSCFGFFFVHGFHFTSLATIAPLVKQMFSEAYFKRNTFFYSQHTIQWLWQLVSGAYLIGLFIGGMITSLLISKLSRKMILTVSLVISIIGTSLQFIGSFFLIPEFLIIGRLVSGVAGGISYGSVVLYLSELSPIQYRGLITSCTQLSISLGSLCAQILCLRTLLGSENLWWTIFIALFLTHLATIFALPLLAESPVYLLNTGKIEEANKAVSRLGYKQHDNKEFLQSIKISLRRETSGHLKLKDIFREKSKRISLLLSCLSFAALHLSGIVVISFYSHTIFLNIGLNPSLIEYAVLLISVVLVISGAIGVGIIDRVGRRRLFLVSLVGTVVGQVLLMIAMQLQKMNSNFVTSTVLSITSLAGLVIVITLFGAGLTAVAPALMSELLNLQMKSTGTAFVTSTSFTIAIALGLFSDYLLVTINGYLFLIFAVLLTLIFIYIYKYLPETKNKQSWEILNEIEEKQTQCIFKNKIKESLYSSY